MLYTIESDALRVAVSEVGAELQSVYSKTIGEEFLWQGDPAHWGYRAPILFPIVGKMKNGTYTYAGKTYAMPKHGFVRKAKFLCATHERDRLTFVYTDNSETAKVYPFAFALEVSYAVDGHTLNIEYRVTNRTTGEMFFGLGAHEAYRCPRREDEAFDDYFLTFENGARLESHSVNCDSGLFTGERYAVIDCDAAGMIPLNYSLFEKDALIFQHVPSQKVRIESKRSTAVVEVAYDAPHLGIWTKPGAPFICIEPWCGLPDYESTDGAFEKKAGNVRLDEGETFVFKHSVAVYS